MYNPKLNTIRKQSVEKLFMTLSFLDLAQKLYFIKKYINKLDYTKTKNACSSKDTLKRMKREATDWENNLQIMKKLYLEYIKNSQN